MGEAIRKEKVTPERHSRLHEAQEQRHRRAGAEGGCDPEDRRQDVPNTLPLAAQQLAGALRAEEGAQDAHEEDYQGEQQQDLRHVVQEEPHGGAKMASGVQAQDVVAEVVSHTRQSAVRGYPREARRGQAHR